MKRGILLVVLFALAGTALFFVYQAFFSGEDGDPTIDDAIGAVGDNNLALLDAQIAFEEKQQLIKACKKTCGGLGALIFSNKKRRKCRANCVEKYTQI